MNKLYVISGVTGMTSNKLVRQILENNKGSVIGFDNFFCSPLDTVEDVIGDERFRFYQYDINNAVQMVQIEYEGIESLDILRYKLRLNYRYASSSVKGGACYAA